MSDSADKPDQIQLPSPLGKNPLASSVRAITREDFETRGRTEPPKGVAPPPPPPPKKP